MNSSELLAEINRLKAENEELKKQKTESKTVPVEKASSYYDYFFTPKKEQTPETIIRRSSDSDLIVNSTQTPIQKIKLSEELLSSFSDKFKPFEEKEHSSDDSDESEINSNSKIISDSSKLVDHNIAMARLITKATEKDEVPKIKLKGVENEHLHKFLSEYSPDSDLSAVYQFPKEYRKSLAILLNIPVGVSLVNFYKDSKGKNQRFIQDIVKILTEAKDFNLVAMIKTHDISKITTYDSSKVLDMISECKQQVSMFKSVIYDFNTLEIKRRVASKILSKYSSGISTIKRP